MKLQLTVTRAALRVKEADLLTAERNGKRLSTELARLRNLVRRTPERVAGKGGHDSGNKQVGVQHETNPQHFFLPALCFLLKRICSLCTILVWFRRWARSSKGTRSEICRPNWPTGVVRATIVWSTTRSRRPCPERSRHNIPHPGWRPPDKSEALTCSC